MKEKFENRKLTGTIKVKLDRDDHSCGKYWEADKEHVIDSIVDTIRKYEAKGYKLTLRQLYYQLVSSNEMPNDDACYSKLSSLLDDCRYSGKVDWNSIEDRGRIPYTPYYEDSMQDAIKDMVDRYTLDRREGQPVYLELWSEKDAISNILKRATRNYTLTVGINKGFASSTAIYNAYDRFTDTILDEKKKVIILYFGDHDPSGLDMIRDIRERIEFMMVKGLRSGDFIELVPEDDEDNGIYPLYDLMEKHGLYEQFREALDNDGDYEYYQALAVVKEYFEIKHIGLTQAQIKFYKLPPNPAKLSDPRAKKYVAEHGNISWEVDALEPQEIEKIIKDSLLALIDESELNKVLAQERTDKQKLLSLIKKK